MIISPESIKKLRDLTNAGILDCKKALLEAKGDFESAIDYLRKKGLAVAASKIGRSASEGAIAVCVSDLKGALIELNAETDFVARNENFQKLALDIVEIACKNQLTYADLLKADYPGKDYDVEKGVTELVAVIKENIQLRRSAVLSVNQGVITSYIHNAYAPHIGKIGVLVALESSAPNKEKLSEIGKKIAMHIAAVKPLSLKVEDLPNTTIQKEKEIYMEQAKASGRPDNILEKMVEGRLRKFYEESVLLEQKFVMDNQITIKDFIEQESKNLGVPIELTGYKMFVLGDGIEKEFKDFKQEVEAQLK